jgi:hypothetical protein
MLVQIDASTDRGSVFTVRSNFFFLFEEPHFLVYLVGGGRSRGRGGGLEEEAGGGGIFKYLPSLEVVLLRMPVLCALLYHCHDRAQNITFLPPRPTWHGTSVAQLVVDMEQAWVKTRLPLALSTNASYGKVHLILFFPFFICSYPA